MSCRQIVYGNTMKDIYLDYAAATPVRQEVLDAMQPYGDQAFGNPSSFHYKGLEASQAIGSARGKIAQILGCLPEELVFTSGGTESINLALQGLARPKRRGHIVTTAIEHAAVLETCIFLEGQGFEVTYVKPQRNGIVVPEDIRKAIRPDTFLVSVMYANNEIGTIQRIRDIGLVCREQGIAFHTDACQAAGMLDLNVEELRVDLLSINGSKVYGPKGVGLLYIRSGIELQPLQFGGGQEKGRRSGTENVAGIVGLAHALELAQSDKETENKRLTVLRDYLINDTFKAIPRTILNGDPTLRLPNNVNLTFLDVEGESLVLHLNELGIYAATGSACNSKNLKPSHVLTAIGVSGEAIHGSVRFSLGLFTTKQQIEYLLGQLPQIVERLRQISPVHINKDNIYIK